jgi:hypothetical protein
MHNNRFHSLSSQEESEDGCQKAGSDEATHAGRSSTRLSQIQLLLPTAVQPNNTCLDNKLQSESIPNPVNHFVKHTFLTHQFVAT